MSWSDHDLTLDYYEAEHEQRREALRARLAELARQCAEAAWRAYWDAEVATLPRALGREEWIKRIGDQVAECLEGL